MADVATIAEKELVDEQTLQSALAGRINPDRFSLKRLGEAGRYGLMTKDARVDTAAIDTRQLIVPGTITTQDPDRSNDVVVSMGVVLDDHAKNPVVLFEHGYAAEIGPKVIATADDESGAYRVFKEEGRIRSYSRFSQKFEYSEQLFELYAEGLLCGLSIGVIPVQVEYRKDQDLSKGGFPGLLIASCKLFEYSFCSVPDNPNALADKVLGKGLLCGRKILPGILKSLSPHLPARAQTVTSGFVPLETETPAMPTTATPNPAASVAVVTKKKAAPAVGKNGKPVLYTKAADSDEYTPLEHDSSTTTTMSADTSPETEEEEDNEEHALGNLPDRPVGAIVSQGLYDRLCEVMEFVERAAGVQENERLAAILDSLAESLNGHSNEISEFHGAEFPDQEPLAKAEDLEDEADKEGEDDKPYSEEEVEKRKRLSVAVKKLAARVALLRKKRAAQAVVTKRMSKGARGVCMKAAGFLGEVSEHEGELKESHRSAAALHKSRLEDLASDGAADPYSEEDVEKTALKAQNEKLKRALEKKIKEHENLLREFRKAQRGR